MTWASVNDGGRYKQKTMSDRSFSLSEEDEAFPIPNRRLGPVVDLSFKSTAVRPPSSLNNSPSVPVSTSSGARASIHHSALRNKVQQGGTTGYSSVAERTRSQHESPYLISHSAPMEIGEDQDEEEEEEADEDDEDEDDGDDGDVPSTITVIPSRHKETPQKQTKPSKSSGVHKDIPDYTEKLPQRVREQLERWYSRYGRTLPPCASRTHIQSSQDGDSSEWRHDNTGEIMRVSVYTMNKPGDPRPDQRQSKRLIIAQGLTQGPYIICFHSGGGSKRDNRWVSRFKVWLGVDSGSAGLAGDRDGFEFSPSITKSSFPRQPSLTPSPLSSEGDEIDGDISYDYPRKRNPVRAAKILSGFYGNQFIDADGTRKIQVPGQPGPVPLKRTISHGSVDLANPSRSKKGKGKEPIRNTSTQQDQRCKNQVSGAIPTNFSAQEQRHHQEMNISSAVEIRIPLSYPECIDSRQIREKDMSGNKALGADHPAQGKRDDQLSKHIKNNTEFWFWPLNSKYPPRIRPYDACDNVRKLFGQALTGRVFDCSPDVANVLTLNIGDLTDTMTLMEEDDPAFREQDFQMFLLMLRESPCWSVRDAGISGSCVVVVKAMS